MFNWFLNEILFNKDKGKLVYIDGEWHPVNKLNTNPRDLAELFTDFLFENKSNGFVKEILEGITKNGKIDYIKQILLDNKVELNSLFKSYYSKSQKDLFKYVSNNIKDSKHGEKIENNIKEKLESISGTKTELRYKCLYQGGNGDFVDMIFSVDLIFQSPNGEIKTIQVKANNDLAQLFIKDTKKTKAVDLVMWPSINKDGKEVYKMYNITTGLEKEIPV
jgi:hypothetical protein